MDPSVRCLELFLGRNAAIAQIRKLLHPIERRLDNI